jgi:hypothetical protein
MALQTVRIGSLENITQYDDSDFDSAVETDQPIKAGAPVDGNDVMRLGDVGTLVGDVFGPAISVDSNIVEFDGVTGKKLKDGGLSHTNVADAISKKHTQGTDTALGALGTKNPPIDADKLIYRDSTSSDALVTSTWTQVKAFLKTYFDTVYALASHAISSHSDTSLAGISNNDLMQWDDPSSKWEPKSIAEVILNQDINPNDVTVGGDLTLSALTTKNPPIDADKVIYRDSTASDGLVTSTWTQIKAFLKTYFDTLYAPSISSWTPGISFGGASVGITYGTATGLYTQNGDIINAFGYISLTSKGSSVGDATITGLPATVKNDNGAYSGVSIGALLNITFADQVFGIALKNTTTIALSETSNAGAYSTLTDADFANNSQIRFSLVYKTN